MVSQQLVLVGGNNVTLSQSLDALSLSVTVTISQGVVTVSQSFAAGMSNIGNILGDTGLVSDRLVLVGGNNVTLSQSIIGNSATITISDPIPVLSMWRNALSEAGGLAFNPPANTFVLIPLDPKNDNIFPGNMTVSTLYMNQLGMGGTATGTFNSFTSTFRLGIYTRNGSSLSLLNSASSTFGNSDTTATTISALYNAGVAGGRYLTFDASLFSASLTFSQTEYYLGYLFHTSGFGAGFQWTDGFKFLSSGIRSGTFGNSITSGNTSMGWYPFIGESTGSLASTDPLPNSIQLSELNKNTIVAAYFPGIIFNNVSSDF